MKPLSQSIHAEYASIGWKRKKEKFAESHREELEAVQEDVKILRDVRRWLNQVLPPEQYRQPPELDGRKSLQGEIKRRSECIKRQQAAQSQPSRPQRKQDMEH